MAGRRDGPGPGFRASRRWAWLAFGLIAAFSVAQVGWWIAFQRSYVQDDLSRVLFGWLQEVRLAQDLLEATPPAERPRILSALQEEFPHLTVQNGRVGVNPRTFAEYRSRETGALRMFAYEAPFFLLVVLLGLWVIASSMRSEREFKRRQENFLLSASHEFRTPLGTLRLLLETLQYRDLPVEKRTEYLQNMGLELHRLDDLSERLLATARLQQGLLSTDERVHDLREVVKEILEGLRPSLEARGAELHLDIPAAPLWVEVDAQALALLVSNLLDNAVKYSSSHHKPVWTRLTTVKGRACLAVEDSGVGVRAQEVRSIFEPFYRAGNQMDRRVPGLGLGLYLVRSLAELMGGEVHYESLQLGSRFVVCLPLKAGTAVLREAGRDTG